MSGRVLVYGGRGALGAALVEHFLKTGWWVCSVDVHQNDKANSNLLVDVSVTATQQAETLKTDLLKELGDGTRLDGIFCVAGGWAGGSAASKDFVKNTELMLQQSVLSSVVATSLAASFLKENGVLVLTGAQPALKPTPGMIGYGLAKAAVHHLTRSVGAEKGGLPTGARALAILPVTLDTPMNRKWMPTADTSAWTPLSFVAELFTKWLADEDIPKSGSTVQLITKGGETELVIE